MVHSKRQTDITSKLSKSLIRAHTPRGRAFRSIGNLNMLAEMLR